MFLLILAQVAASAPVPLIGPDQGTISSYDYPVQAYRHGWEGPVGVDLTIGTKGEVTHCSVIASSGHDVLDKQTCTLMTARAVQARVGPSWQAGGGSRPATHQLEIALAGAAIPNDAIG